MAKKNLFIQFPGSFLRDLLPGKARNSSPSGCFFIRFHFPKDLGALLFVQVQVLTELYAETNQTGIIGRMEIDGMPGLSEAFCRVKLA